MKYIFTATANALIATLDTEEGKYTPKSFTFLQPTFELGNDAINVSDFGIYKAKLEFENFETINGEAPTDLENAQQLLNDLVANFSGGGVTPQNYWTSTSSGGFDNITNNNSGNVGIGREAVDDVKLLIRNGNSDNTKKAIAVQNKENQVTASIRNDGYIVGTRVGSQYFEPTVNGGFQNGDGNISFIYRLVDGIYSWETTQKIVFVDVNGDKTVTIKQGDGDEDSAIDFTGNANSGVNNKLTINKDSLTKIEGDIITQNQIPKGGVTGFLAKSVDGNVADENGEVTLDNIALLNGINDITIDTEGNLTITKDAIRYRFIGIIL